MGRGVAVVPSKGSDLVDVDPGGNGEVAHGSGDLPYLDLVRVVVEPVGKFLLAFGDRFNYSGQSLAELGVELRELLASQGVVAVRVEPLAPVVQGGRADVDSGILM